jgi:hypothetical protein
MGLVMETNNSDFERYQKAKKQVEEIKAFYIHAFWFVLVVSGLLFINLRYSPQQLWFLWTFFGWGIGLLFHAIRVFNLSPFLNKDWEDKKIKQYMNEEKNIENKWE